MVGIRVVFEGMLNIVPMSLSSVLELACFENNLEDEL